MADVDILWTYNGGNAAPLLHNSSYIPAVPVTVQWLARYANEWSRDYFYFVAPLPGDLPTNFVNTHDFGVRYL